MLLTTPEKGYCCSQCNYTTNRKYNLDRHIGMVHILERPNVESERPNVELERPNVDFERPNVDSERPNVDSGIRCSGCSKVFTSKLTLSRHVRWNRCKGYVDKFECPHCHATFSSRSSKSHHMSRCNIQHMIQEEEHIMKQVTHIDTQNNTTIETQHNTNIQEQHNVTNNVVVFNFPESLEYDKFKFLKDHMTVPHLEQIFSNKLKPKQGFARYTSAIFERPENRNVYKSGPNTKYCRIWKDGKWVYELDEEVFPLLTYHMSIAALDDINNNKKALKSRGNVDFFNIAKCLDDINTENDENDNYSFALEKLKVAVLNFSERFRLPNVI